MILLEYIIGQHQDGNVSVAVNSKKSRQENPGLFIRRVSGKIVLEFRGLHNANIDTITGDKRVSRIDFYIGMDDLVEQRGLFPTTTGSSLGLPLGLKNPIGTQRIGGKSIRWSGGIGRINIDDIKASFPPFKLSKNIKSDLILNIDADLILAVA